MNTKKNPAAVALGRLGGLAGRGKSKVRKVSSEQARRAVRARWEKYKRTKALLPAACREAIDRLENV